MSEGRTPTATFTLQRHLEQQDVDILHEIVVRAQNDSLSDQGAKDALLQAYDDVYRERHLNPREDRACVDVLFKLLNPATQGESLYHKFENILQDQGIVLAFDDDATTNDGRTGWSTKPPELESTQGRSSAPPLAAHSDGPRQASADDTGESADAEALAELDRSLDRPPPHISYMMRRAVQRDRAVLARQTVDVWRDAVQAARDRQDEARADALYAIRLKRKVLKQCLAVFQDMRASQQQADQIYLRRLAGNVLGKTCDHYKVCRVASIDNDRLKGLSLYKLTVAGREARLWRQKKNNLKENALSKLMETSRQQSAHASELSTRLAQYQVSADKESTNSILTFLAQRSRDVVQQSHLADTTNSNNLCRASIRAWTDKIDHVKQLNVTAEDASEYFLIKRVLKKFQETALFQKERRQWLARWTLTRWRSFVKVRKHNRYDGLYRQHRRTAKLQLARTMLNKWRQKAMDQHQSHESADRLYDSRLLTRIARPFIENVYGIADQTSKNQATAIMQADKFLKRRVIAALESKEQSATSMANQADRFRQYRLEQRALLGVRQMQFKAFELQRRTDDAHAFRARNDKRYARIILARMRAHLARSQGYEGMLQLESRAAITPARKREELLLHSSTRLSTTPAYTPFANRLRQGPRVLENIDDEIENTSEDSQHVEMDELTP